MAEAEVKEKSAPAGAAEEESVEDILHSIRDIIADQNGEKTVIPTLDPDAAPQPEPEDVLELTEIAVEPETPPTEPVITEAPETGDVLSDIDQVLSSNPTPATPRNEQPAASSFMNEPLSPSMDQDALIADPAARASTAAIQNLVNAIPDPKIDSPRFRSGNTLEELVKESMKPMIADWLNKNLPKIVERVVEREIKKIIPRE